MEEENSTEPEALDEEEQKEERPKRRLTKKRKGIIIAVIVIIVALVIGLWGAVPSDYLEVGDILANPLAYVDRSIEVKGLVADWDSTVKVFNLSDGENDLMVSYITLPEGFNNGKDVVVRGTLVDNDGLVLESSEITVGCPSKY
ncbi:MAG: cytochrome c maturation protein CcmE [Methanobacteriota archaeon]|nr:MAG: cytochrome c maturation protein CcmE [Euryarchaeota archaeon]